MNEAAGNSSSSDKRNVLSILNENYETMTPRRKKIARLILDHPNEAIHMTISELAEAAGLKSEASIVRFYKSIGFANYKDFKIEIAKELTPVTFVHSAQDINIGDSVHTVRKKIGDNVVSALNDSKKKNQDEVFNKAIDLIMKSTRVILIGYGAAYAICQYAAFRFMEIGINCHHCPDPHINTILFANPKKEEVFFIISSSGETSDDIRFLPRLKEKGIPIIALTSRPESTLGKAATVFIDSSTQELSELSDPIYSRILQFITIDTLYILLSSSMGKGAVNNLYQTRQLFKSLKNPDILNSGIANGISNEGSSDTLKTK